MTVPGPADRGSPILDHAGILSDDAEDSLRTPIEALKDDLGFEIVVMTVPGFDGVIGDFSQEVSHEWGLGGEAELFVLMLLVEDRRRFEFHVGYGAGRAVGQGWLTEVRSEQMVPHFAAGNFGQALLAGVTAIDEQVRANADKLRHEPPPRQGPPGGPPPIVWVGLFLVAAACGAGGWKLYAGR
ncbi:MAG: TPM domain-containing protein [Proteobacteria bacterium]|nr:TPM domain-containing protein [Pseudomonadota bacterium]